MTNPSDSPWGKLVEKVRTVVGIGDGTLALPPATPELGQLLSRYVDQCNAGLGRDPRAHAAGAEILLMPPDRQVLVLYAAFTRVALPMTRADVANGHAPLVRLCNQLLRKTLPVTADSLAVMLTTSARIAGTGTIEFTPVLSLLRTTARYAKKNALTPGLTAALTQLRTSFEPRRADAGVEEAIAIITGILGETPRAPSLQIEPGEAWSDAVIADLVAATPEERTAWSALLTHCRTATASHPSKKWVAAAATLVAAVGPSFATCAARWLPLVDQPRTKALPAPQPWDDFCPDPNFLLSEDGAEMLKGLAWACASVDDAPLARALADCATASFKKIRWKGPRCPKLGNACLDALALMPTPEAAAQLSRLSTVVKQPTGKKTVVKAIHHVAERTHQTPEDLEELAVPTYDMTTIGLLERRLGGYTATLRVDGDSAVTFTSPAGKVHKTIPAELKRDHPADLKAFQKTAKDVEKMLAGQRTRLERLLMSGRSWTVDQWRQRYADHVLLGPLARRLIWSFTAGGTTTGMFVDGELVDAGGSQFTPAPDAEVRLWHPIGAAVDLVRSWRTFLQDRQLTQPFKQAHREVYILTDAELNTRTYSNRFAAHIIRQHQFRALCEHRGWKTGLVGTWDGGDTTPTLHLPRFDLKVQFWVEPAGNDVGPTGAVTYLATDQVRFYRTGANEPLELMDVPATVFSEVMRDVDLFVGVCSVGNDPAWRDTGGEAFNTYWQSFSFGNLGATAQTRRELLATLLPKLKIANRTTLSDKFLIVRGDLRTYKIHLGSSNILMEPNDQYLCIVPDRRPMPEKAAVFLPFEGDNTLAVILSKAFMLADDRKITDPTILSQIRR